MMIFLAVFFAAFMIDILWVLYFKNIQKNAKMKASFYGSVQYLIGGYITIEYVGNNTLLLAAMAGAFLGTYIALEFLGRKAI